MKFLNLLKRFFTRNIPLKLLAVVFAALIVIVLYAAAGITPAA